MSGSPTGDNSTPGPVGPTTCWSLDDHAPQSGAPGGSAIVAQPAKEIPAEQSHAVLHSFTWTQLGIGGDLLRAATNQPFVFAAPTGGALRAVSLPGATLDNEVTLASDAGHLAIVGASNDDYATSTTGAPQVQNKVWQSVDGTSWTQAPLAPPTCRTPAPSAISPGG